MRPRKPPDATARKGGSTGPALGLAVLAVAIAAGLALSILPRPEQTPPPLPQTPQAPQSFDGPLPDSVSRALGATRDPAERWRIVQQLLAAGREEDAIALLEHTVEALPEEAAAHEQLGEVLRASLGSRGSSAAEGDGDGGATDDGAARWERRRRAVAALNRSAALAPTARLHATIGNLLAPRGEANSSDDAVGACQHYAAALALDATAHAGTTGAAKRLIHLSHATQHGQSAPLGSGRAWLLRLLRPRLAALGGSALPGQRPGHWTPSDCLSCSSEPPPPKSPILRFSRL